VKFNLRFDTFINAVRSPYFLLVWFILMVLSYFFLDKPVALYFQPHEGWLYNVSDKLTVLGYPGCYIALFVVLSLLGYFFFKKTRLLGRSLLILAALISTAIVQNVLKVILGRARPMMLFDEGVFGFKFFQTTNDMWSVPSGLITTGTALLIGLSFVFPRYYLAFLAVLLVMSFSRLVVTVHYVSDTMATMYIMAMVVIWLADLCKKRQWLSLG